MANVVERYADFAAILDCVGPEEVYRQGHTLARFGDEILHVRLILSGLLKLTWTAASGKSVIGAIWQGPLALGGFGGAHNRHWRYSVEVVEECRAISVTRQTFDKAISLHPKAAIHIALHQSALLESELDRNARFSCAAPEDRLLQFLQSLLGTQYCIPSNKGFKLRMPLKQCELAALLSVTPEHLCRLLKRLAKLGVLHRDRGWYVLTDTVLRSGHMAASISS